MQNNCAKTARDLAFFFAFAAAFAFLSVKPVFAQGGRRLSGPAERLRRERAARKEHQMVLKSLENLGKTKPAEVPSNRLIYEQVSEDFQRMQVVNNEMMHATFPSKGAYTPDSKGISKSAAEINKRASRLISNLNLPDSEDKKQGPASQDILNVEQLKSSLLTLNSLVVSFSANPFFKHPTVVDLAESVRAKSDLEGIIDLSRRIKQSAERLKN